MADRIVVMRGGQIEQVGTPIELYDRPANAFVATFIGSPAMNLIRGTVAAAAEGPRLRTRDGVEWPVPAGLALAAGREVDLGLRPEDLRLADDGLPARVIVTEPTGAETHVVMRVGDTEIVGVFRQRLALRPDQMVRVEPDPERIHVFDAGNGGRIDQDSSP